MTSAYRFRLYTAGSIGAYTLVDATTQAEAFAKLRKRTARWENVAPLHGPDRSPYWFD